MLNYSDCVVSTRVRLARNIAKIPFPHKLGFDERIFNTIFNGVAKTVDKLFDYNIFSMNKLSEVERLSLLEKHIISPKLAKNIDTGLVIISKDSKVSIMINEEDHIRAQCVLKNYNLNEAFATMNVFDNQLAKELDIAYDDKFGFLTACPTNLGTGMRASVMMFLPALSMTGEIENVILKTKQKGVTIRGVYGEGSSSDGYMYQISNQIAIGVNEEDILTFIDSMVRQIASYERTTSEILFAEKPLQLEDSINRALGILKYCEMISSGEFMKLIALVKFGVNLGFIKLDINMINQLIEEAQPANLCRHSGKILDNLERDVERSKLIKKYLEG